MVTQESLPCTVQVPRLAKDCCVEEVRLYKCGACDDYLNLQEEIRFLKCVSLYAVIRDILN